MKQGLLWYDDDPSKTLEKKIAQAAARHKKKFGKVPNTCYINFETEVKQVGPVRVKVLSTVLPHHFWIGVNKKET